MSRLSLRTETQMIKNNIMFHQRNSFFSVSIFSLLSRGNITIHIEYGNRTKIDIISIFGMNGRKKNKLHERWKIVLFFLRLSRFSKTSYVIGGSKNYYKEFSVR